MAMLGGECSACCGPPETGPPCCGNGEAQTLWESTTVDNYTDSFLITNDWINSDTDTPTETGSGLEYDNGAGSTWKMNFGGQFGPASFELYQYHLGQEVMFFSLVGICGSAAAGEEGSTIIYLYGSNMQALTIRHSSGSEWVNPVNGVRLVVPKGEDSKYFTGRYTFTNYRNLVFTVELRDIRQLLRGCPEEIENPHASNPLP